MNIKTEKISKNLYTPLTIKGEVMYGISPIVREDETYYYVEQETSGYIAFPKEDEGSWWTTDEKDIIRIVEEKQAGISEFATIAKIMGAHYETVTVDDKKGE